MISLTDIIARGAICLPVILITVLLVSVINMIRVAVVRCFTDMRGLIADIKINVQCFGVFALILGLTTAVLFAALYVAGLVWYWLVG